MKKFFKSNIKLIVGIVIGAIISGTGVYAATIVFDSDQVSYDNTNTNLQINNADVDNVQDAIDAIYNKVTAQLNTCNTNLTTCQSSLSSGTCPSGFVKTITNQTTGTYTCALPPAAEMIETLLTETNAAGNKIYTGSDPDNYVWFNDEQWRIIGVYDDKLKIVKATPSTSSQAYKSAGTSNVWSTSDMKSYLYNTYWTNSLSALAQNMVEENAIWNVGACGYNIAAQAAYNCASATTWTGKIGLIANYEYMYAAENDGTCWTTSGYSYHAKCYQKDWLHSTVSNGWTISPNSDYSNGALYLNAGGDILSLNIKSEESASPVVYLKSTVVIIGGNGKVGESNSYKLGI